MGHPPRNCANVAPPSVAAEGVGWHLELRDAPDLSYGQPTPNERCRVLGCLPSGWLGIGHWGGRYIWQLADSADLVVAWRRCNEGETAREREVELLSAFTQQYARLPFANLRS